MGVFEWLRAVFTPYREEKRAVAPPTNVPDPRPIPAGRTSINDVASTSSNWVLVQPEDPEGFWRLRNLDVNTLDTSTPKELLDLLSDLSPEVSRAIWDFLRMANPGWEIRAYELTDEKTESEAAMLHLNDFVYRMREKYGTFDVIINRLLIGAFLRGALCAELVLDTGASETLDLATPDPYSIRFRKKPDATFKEIWEPGQFQGQDFVSLDIPTFRYIPIDPLPASPYGRSMASPALFTTIFTLSLLHDVKRVVMQQGYKRLDITINTEQAMDTFSYDQQGFNTLGEYVQAAIDQIRTAYAALEPEDAFIHTDIFELGNPVGTADADAISAISMLIERLEKMATRALKSNGLIMGTGDTTSESDSNRKWEVHVAGVKSVQHLLENMFESLFQLSLQAKGIQAKVSFRFSELRASEMFRDEQTLTLKIQNARAAYEAGFVSQDEASQMAVGHDAFVEVPLDMQGETELLENNSDGNELLTRPVDEDLDTGEESRGLAIPLESDIFRNGRGVYEKA